MKKFLLLFILFYAVNIYAAPKIDYSKSYQVTSTAASEKYAVFGSFDGNIRAVAYNTSDIFLLDNAHKKPVISLSFNKDGRYMASASQDDEIIFWDMENFKEIKRIKKYGKGVRAVVLSPKGDKLYIAFPKEVYEYETSKWLNTAIIEGYENGIYSIAINSTGEKLAAGSKLGEIYITDIKKQEIEKVIKAGRQLIISLDFAGNKNTLASGSYDRNIRVYNIENGKTISEFSMFNDTIRGVVLNNEGSKVLAGSDDGNILIYNIENSRIISQKVEGAGEITSLSAPKSFKFTAYGKGLAYEEERCGIITYPANKGVYRKLYLFNLSDIIISESGYMAGRGSFGEYISSYYRGNKESIADIMEKYFRKDKLRINLP